MLESNMYGYGSGRGDRWLAACVWLAAVAVTAVFVWILGDLLRHGVGRLSFAFLIEAPESAGRAGGIGPILVSTAWILAVSLAAALPLGLGTAVLLAELGATESRFTSWVRRSLDVLAGVPSIVFGLFGNALFCVALGLGFSILSGGLTLACMILPILIRSTEEGFRAVPQEIRLAAAALAMSRSRTLFQVLLPAAAPGLVVGVVLGFGRAIAETAALIFTSGYVDRMPSSVHDSGRALSIHIYDLAINIPGGEGTAYATALVLVAILLCTNSATSFLGERWLRGRYHAV
ncbi:MAG: phosphate ABC transporter permease PstA [Thermoanaerobaculia bacterium]